MLVPEHSDARLTSSEYFGLVERGVMSADDRVELLEGVIISMSPQNPPHAAAVRRTDAALRRALGSDAVISVQSPLVLGQHSVPEPDVAVLPGKAEDYDAAHPTTALLVVEVADSSLAQDRLTKTRIYAAASIPEMWIVNLRERCVEVFRDPDAEKGTYRTARSAGIADDLELVSGARVSVSEILPTAD